MRKRLTIIIIEHAVLIALAILALTSCSTQRVVTVPQKHSNEVVDSAKTSTDQVRVDSIYVSHIERIEGERIVIRDTLIKFQKVATHDTITRYVEHNTTDSIPYPVEVVREVRKRNAYDRFTARGFWCFVVLIVGGIALWVGSKTPYGKMAVSAIKILLK